MVDNNMPRSIIINLFRIGKSTLNKILRNVDKFKKFKIKKEELGLTEAAKTAKKQMQASLQARQCPLHQFRQEREKGCLVTGLILLKKVCELHRLNYSEHSLNSFHQARSFHKGFKIGLARLFSIFVLRK